MVVILHNNYTLLNFGGATSFYINTLSLLLLFLKKKKEKTIMGFLYQDYEFWDLRWHPRSHIYSNKQLPRKTIIDYYDRNTRSFNGNNIMTTQSVLINYYDSGLTSNNDITHPF